MPPRKIQIMNHLAGSRIEIKENEEVAISCKVSDAKPRAGIVWYRNNVALNPRTGKFALLSTGAKNILLTKQLNFQGINLERERTS